jgi:hypothetical protein
MRGALRILVFATAVAVVSAPAFARAEGYVSPWVAANAGNNISNFDNGRAGFGINAGGMGGGIVGGELAFGWSPSFFGTRNDFGDNSVIDLMGNVIIGVPIGGTYGVGVRPFVTAGLGLLRTQVDGGTIARVQSHNNMLGWDAGAGVMGFFNDHVGLRGDLKYLRSVENDSGQTIIGLNTGRFRFWRAAVGVVFR